MNCCGGGNWFIIVGHHCRYSRVVHGLHTLVYDVLWAKPNLYSTDIDAPGTLYFVANESISYCNAISLSLHSHQVFIRYNLASRFPRWYNVVFPDWTKSQVECDIGVVSGARTWAALMPGTDATAFDRPPWLGQAGGKSGIGLDSLEFGKGSFENVKIPCR